jgi:hypothetical protein
MVHNPHSALAAVDRLTAWTVGPMAADKAATPQPRGPDNLAGSRTGLAAPDREVGRVAGQSEVDTPHLEAASKRHRAHPSLLTRTG